MGLQADCEVFWQERRGKGTAKLEEKELLFKGPFRLKIPFSSITHLQERDGELQVVFAEDEARFVLGEQASRWLDKIKNPRTLMDKLGIKPESRVAVMNIEDQDFWALLRGRAGNLWKDDLTGDLDMILIGFHRRQELDEIGRFEPFLRRNGAIWAVWPKGRPELTEDHIRGAFLAAGFVDNKVVSFSPELSGLRLVIPVSRR